MRFDHDEEFSIDWGAIDRAHRRQRRPLSSKIMPLILWTISMAMLIWLASPYQPITQYILAQDEAVDLRQALNDNQAFPPDGTYVSGKELALGYKGAEWMRLRRFGITREEVVYIQIIGAVCPYEMPRPLPKSADQCTEIERRVRQLQARHGGQCGRPVTANHERQRVQRP